MRSSRVPDVRAQLIQSVELTGGRGELVVKVGQFLALDAADRHAHLGLLPGEVTGDQCGLEGAGVTLGGPGERLIQFRHGTPAAQFVGVPAGLGARNFLAVDRCVEVDAQEVARFRGTLDRNQHREPVAQARELLAQLLVAHRRLRRQ